MKLKLFNIIMAILATSFTLIITHQFIAFNIGFFIAAPLLTVLFYKGCQLVTRRRRLEGEELRKIGLTMLGVMIALFLTYFLSIVFAGGTVANLSEGQTVNETIKLFVSSLILG